VATLSVYMASDDHKWLIARANRIATIENRTMSYIMVEALREWLERYELQELENSKTLKVPPGA